MKRVKMALILSFLVIFFMLISNANSASFNAASCSQSDVQTQINAAKDGDTVSIPAGSCSWSSSVSWSNKNISVIGAGVGSTIISAGSAFKITADTKAGFRISGMTLTYSNSSSTLISMINNTNVAQSGWRVDHIAINQTNGSGTGSGIIIIGMLWGLIDHITWNNNGYSVQAISNYAYSNSYDSGSNIGGIAWTKPLDPGGPTAVYVEDSTFNFNSGANPQIATGDTQMGGRMVWRHNAIHGAMTMTHANWDSTRGGQKFEAYNNTIDATNGTRPFLLRSGWNILFNNTISGSWPQVGRGIFMDNVRDNQGACAGNGNSVCNGSSSYDGNTSGQTGWPCADQIGVGEGAWQHQTLRPVHLWNNSDNATENCPSPHILANRDYYDQVSGIQTSATSPFNGTSGTGWGTMARRPTTCTTNALTPGYGVGYFATDQGTQGTLYTCSATNTWTAYYTPYTYPHPLQGIGPWVPNLRIVQ